MNPGPDDFTDTDTPEREREREREDGLKFVIALKPTLSLVYFPKPSGFQIEGVWRRFWPGTTVHWYSWTCRQTWALAVWRWGSPGHTPSRMDRSLDPIQSAPSRQDHCVYPCPLPPPGALGASTHTPELAHIPTSVLCCSWICTSRSYTYGNVSLRSVKCTIMHLAAILSFTCLSDLSFTRL